MGIDGSGNCPAAGRDNKFYFPPGNGMAEELQDI